MAQEKIAIKSEEQPKILAEHGFNPWTSRLWAQHTSTASAANINNSNAYINKSTTYINKSTAYINK